METVIDKEWKERVNAFKYVSPNLNSPESFVYPQVYIVIYSDMSKRYVKGVFKNIEDAREHKERLKRAVKKRSIYQKLLMTMAGRHETLFIETHIVRGHIV